MRSVLISIKPKYVEKIANGEKTIEVRKTAPKETPFKVYIYATKSKDLLLKVSCLNTKTKIHKTDYKIINLDYCTNEIANGKVIGEFICDKVYELFPFAMGTGIELLDELVSPEQFCKKSCLTEQEICDYIGEKDGYGWHISDLKIYEEPKELNEFKISCNRKNPCCSSCNRFTGKPWDICNDTITRPPQSYMFVEEVRNDN